MKIALATDAWHPQINGVVRTLSLTVQHLRKQGHQVLVIEPGRFATVPCPTYPEIRLAYFAKRRATQLLSEFNPDAVHIATEGPVGAATRKWCLSELMPFTTSYHTQFPEYLRARAPIPLALSYALLRRFHGAAKRTFVATPALQAQLESRKFDNIVRWSRGVDVQMFKPGAKTFLSMPRPIAIYVGRVAVEKNIGAFLDMKWEGSKVVVGDGPERAQLEREHSDVHFVGYKVGDELAQYVAAADVFVFPSRTDTFGLVLLEAMACGIPVAAYPVTGPIDVVKRDVSGILDNDLGAATRQALHLNPKDCRDHAMGFTWEAATTQFVSNLAARG
jgi:glycosyltransferase involved in cell wall biosynthesis